MYKLFINQVLVTHSILDRLFRALVPGLIWTLDLLISIFIETRNRIATLIKIISLNLYFYRYSERAGELYFHNVDRGRILLS